MGGEIRLIFFGKKLSKFRNCVALVYEYKGRVVFSFLTFLAEDTIARIYFPHKIKLEERNNKIC